MNRDDVMNEEPKEWVMFGNDEIVNINTGEILPLSNIKNIKLSTIDLDSNAKI